MKNYILVLLAMAFSFWNMLQILIKNGWPFGKVEWVIVALCVGYLPLFYVLGRKTLQLHKEEKEKQAAEREADLAEQAHEAAREKLELYGDISANDTVESDESKSPYDC